VEANRKLGFDMDLREYGLGAQILADLGLKRSGCSRTIRESRGARGYGLKIVEQVSIRTTGGIRTTALLESQAQENGHLL